jgi:hypothetical protein
MWLADTTRTEAVLAGRSVVAKWLGKVTAAKTKATRAGGGHDDWLYKNRPALEEYMTELFTPSGDGRDLAVLMVCVSDEGFRIGLKDEAEGGWLWREAGTVAEGLDSIEKALQSGKAKFAAPGGTRGKRR